MTSRTVILQALLYDDAKMKCIRTDDVLDMSRMQQEYVKELSMTLELKLHRKYPHFDNKTRWIVPEKT